MNCKLSVNKKYTYRQIIDKFYLCENIYKIQFYRNNVNIWIIDENNREKIINLIIRRNKKSELYNLSFSFIKNLR